jgi:hypothetical protein
MRKIIAFLMVPVALFFSQRSFAQIDLNNLDIRDIIGKVMHVDKGFAPKFSLGNTPVKRFQKLLKFLTLKRIVK